MSIFSKLFSTFKKPETYEEKILHNAINNNVPKLNPNNIKIDRPKIDKIVVTEQEEKTLSKNLYTFNFTEEKFCKILINPEEKEWFYAMYEILPKYGINTPERVAGFLAQTCHESSDYRILEENLYYSAAGLRKTFPKYFGSASTAAAYAKKPEKIANLVYRNRMGNGNTESGEGFKFRGRGPIQITGKNNYTQCSYFLFDDDRLIKDPDLLLKEKKICIMSACWYWEVRKINKYCDKLDITGMTKAINGGKIGLSDRKVRFEKYLKILK